MANDKVELELMTEDAKKTSVWKIAGLIAGGGIVALFFGIVIAGLLWEAPGQATTPSGMQRNTSYYIEMPDGARIAADLWVPEDLALNQRIPTVIEGTRYWRDMGLTFLGRIAAMSGIALPGVHPSNYNAYFPANGYAMLTIDVRGTGASSGVHTTEYSLEETRDYKQIIDWVIRQPWSSGDVFAIGVSYSGTSAELMTTTQHPALKAVAPLYSDFDAQIQLATPGGVYQPAFIEAWSQLVGAMDRNDLCGVISADQPDAEASDCSGPALLISGVKPVAGDEAFLREAVAQHDSPKVAEMVRSLEFRDSPWGATEVLPSQNSPYGLKTLIERSGVPMFVVTGWFDAATTNGALARFATFSNPQTLWIGAFSHGGDYDTDPFKAADEPSTWTGTEQLDKVLAFFERHRSDKPSQKPQPNEINYYVNGANGFVRTRTWPPTHLQPRTYYFGSNNTLNTTQPGARHFDRYIIDPATATASTSRWNTQLGGGDVIYDLRNEMADRMLTYTSPEFSADTEVTGSVVLDLWMTSDQPEGALHAYLEDVAPDGKVRYLTEGVLNLLHRANTKNPVYPVFGPAHSFLSRDAKPVPVGRMVLFLHNALCNFRADQTRTQASPEFGGFGCRVFRTDSLRRVATSVERVLRTDQPFFSDDTYRALEAR